MNKQERKEYTRQAESFIMDDFWVKQHEKFIASLPDNVEPLPINASAVNLPKGKIFNGRKLARRLLVGDIFAVFERE
jgi:hypothetical protein